MKRNRELAPAGEEIVSCELVENRIKQTLDRMGMELEAAHDHGRSTYSDWC